MSDLPYRFFDHTGDFGVSIEADDEGAAFAALARAFLDLLTDAPQTVRELEQRDIDVEGIDAPDLLVTLGNELLYLFEAEGFLCARLEVDHVDETELSGTAHGEAYDPDRHPIARPIKAVTHHRAEIHRDERGVTARLIFDL